MNQKKHTTSISVRYAETDRMGVVYYANYLIWFEVARTEYLKSLGISYRKLEEEKNIYMMVAESRCVHKRPVTYEDSVSVETWISQIKNASLKFQYKLFANDLLIAEGETAHVFTNKTGRPTKIPADLRAVLAK